MLPKARIRVLAILGLLVALAAYGAIDSAADVARLVHLRVAAVAPTLPMQSLPGKLVLGGGTFIDEMGAETVRLAGGSKARIVLIPTAYGPTEEEGVQQFLDQWSQWHPGSLTILHTRDRDEANDEEFVKPLRRATGVWFFGGKQSRLVETYGGTLVQKELQALFQRGGVVGGNCAGAMALGELMIVANEENDEVVLSEGLCIVPKLIADSHWLERNRIERLRRVIESHPDHLGLGIDSSTAVILDNGVLRCIGKSYVATLLPVDAPRAVRFDIWQAGEKVDLALLAAGEE
jgi:cyanophycinase